MSTENILAPVAALVLPDAGQLSGSAQRALTFIREFVIATQEDYGFAAEELRSIKTKAKKLEEQRTSIVGPINQAVKAVNDLFRGPSGLLSEAESIIKGKMLAWDREQERIAAEQRRIAEQAAEAERMRLAEEADKLRKESEQRAAAAAAAQAAGNTTAAQLELDAADRANAQAASAALAAQMTVAAPIAAPAAKVKGISTAGRIDFAVVNLLALVKHIAEHPELISLVTADNVKLRAYVRGLGANCTLPGVDVFEDKTIRARSA